MTGTACPVTRTSTVCTTVWMMITGVGVLGGVAVSVGVRAGPPLAGREVGLAVGDAPGTLVAGAGPLTPLSVG